MRGRLGLKESDKEFFKMEVEIKAEDKASGLTNEKFSNYFFTGGIV